MKLKSYIRVGVLLIVGIVAIATTVSLAFPSQPSVNATALSDPQGQSAFITSTTSLAGGTITETLVNTSVQLPLAERPMLSSSLVNSIQLAAVIIFVSLCAVLFTLSLSRKL